MEKLFKGFQRSYRAGVQRMSNPLIPPNFFEVRLSHSHLLQKIYNALYIFFERRINERNNGR